MSMISCRRRQIAQLSAYSTFHNKWCSLAFDWLKNMTDILIFSAISQQSTSLPITELLSRNL